VALLSDIQTMPGLRLSVLCALWGVLACAAQEPEAKVFRFQGGESVTILLDTDKDKDREAGSQQQLVSSDGFVSSLSFGTVNLFGKTILEATETIREAIKKKTGRLNPEVSILIHALPTHTSEEPRTVFVLGEVKTPRAIQLPREMPYRLAMLLSEVGGPAVEADLTRVKVLRETGGKISAQEVDCTRFARTGQESLGPLLQPGDVVIVERSETITVSGEVVKPGLVNRQSANLSAGAPFYLSRALLAAGGVKASGDKKQIRLIRIRETGERATSTYVLEDGKIANDPVLQSGDVVEVPLGEGILVLGGVTSPGIYYDLGGSPMTLSRLVALAGGPTAKAKTGVVLVVRKRNPGAPVPVNLKAVIEEGKLGEDVRLEAGDMVFIAVSQF
jgi:protein involved in polysaccharide export with SLBB domain